MCHIWLGVMQEYPSVASPTKACKHLRKEPGENKPCVSSFELNPPPQDIPNMFSKPGTPRNNYQGDCDVFQKYREVK